MKWLACGLFVGMLFTLTALPGSADPTATVGAFQKRISPPGEKVLIFNPQALAWAAYSPGGWLVRTGPASGGADWCADVKRSCRTAVGEFRILFKAGPTYRSGKYPLGTCRGTEPGRPGCVPLPYFMPFTRGGQGFHAGVLPGYNASHGCVRLTLEDARWLSEKFVEVGTKVIILPYP